MRVLIVPELYHGNDPSANGTLNDALMLVSDWLDRDPTLHAYLLLPPSDAAGCPLTGNERVTPIEIAPPADLDRAELLTEGGYSRNELAALGSVFHVRDRYIDIVIDQTRTGRFTPL